ncbi:MAG: M15 family metallopeptidase [Prevotellaceae bacterium]|nr:M15 family metallopeptidase [Prevotellaceae bacterium]
MSARGVLLSALLLPPMALAAQDTCFVSSPVPDSVFARMEGKSFAEGCAVARSELRYLRLSYICGDGRTRQGEMVCNRQIADDLVDIFRQLWLSGYRIGRMRLVDDYDADDQNSMKDNNTSCFNYRYISGTRTVSKHGSGMAVDINPLYNPYVCRRQGGLHVEPAEGLPYAAGRASPGNVPYSIIGHDDLCYRLFKAHGFRWGGDWTHNKDYQHFEK